MLLTVKDLQTVLNVGRDTAYALVHAEGFPAIKIGGRFYVSKVELEKWIAKYSYRAFSL